MKWYFLYGIKVNKKELEKKLKINIVDFQKAILRGYKVEYFENLNWHELCYTVKNANDKIVNGYAIKLDDKDFEKIEKIEEYPKYREKKNITIDIADKKISAILFYIKPDYLPSSVKKSNGATNLHTQLNNDKHFVVPNNTNFYSNPQASVKANEMKYMLTYKEFIFEKSKSDLLNDADIQRLDKSTGVIVKFKTIQHRTASNRIKTLKFIVRDPNGSNSKYEVLVQIPDYRIVSRFKKVSTADKVELAIENGDLKIYCPCPDFLYKGYKYKATVDEYGIRDEFRSPDIMNPNLEGTLCKHALAVLNQINNFKDIIIFSIDTYNNSKHS